MDEYTHYRELLQVIFVEQSRTLDEFAWGKILGVSLDDVIHSAREDTFLVWICWFGTNFAGKYPSAI